jgi:hypothetical protein
MEELSTAISARWILEDLCKHNNNYHGYYRFMPVNWQLSRI